MPVLNFAAPKTVIPAMDGIVSPSSPRGDRWDFVGGGRGFDRAEIGPWQC